jgi:hypothetical protein
MLPFLDYIRHPNKLAITLLTHFGQWLPDQIYLKLLFQLKLGHKLDLRHPITFSEKLQWLKIFNRNPEYTQMVDKFSVKEYVDKTIGEEYVIPTLGVWNKPEDIAWNNLPNQFVLKTTHGGGSTGVVICKDKNTFDKQTAIKKLNASLKMDIYRLFKEWPYKNVQRRIIAEQYIMPTDGLKDLSDYKWYCFNGEPKFCQVIQDRTSKETIDFFDTAWRHQDFVGLNPNANQALVPPAHPMHLDVQLQIASRLSQNIPFSRIDLYEAGNHVYFGEITFFPMSGLGSFRPNQYNEILGQMISLPPKYE